MLMIDILRLPGVDEARERLVGDYDEEGCPRYVDERHVDDLIRAVAEAVEQKLKQNIPQSIPVQDG